MSDTNKKPEPEEENLTDEQVAELMDSLSDPLKLEDPINEAELLNTEIESLKDRLMRALADAENNRKRGERDRRDAEVYGGSRLARDLLSVYDNIDRALETVDESQRAAAKSLIEGIELTKRELLATFSKHKIEPIQPDVGDKFDPQHHQAMFEAPMPEVAAGHVIQVMTPGFLIGDRLLRPAQVGVSSMPLASVPTTDE